MTGFKLQRLGMLMEPQAGNPHEVEGVLNPAAARGPDRGTLPLSPGWLREATIGALALHVCSSIAAGDPAGVERLGVADRTEGLV